MPRERNRPQGQFLVEATSSPSMALTMDDSRWGIMQLAKQGQFLVEAASSPSMAVTMNDSRWGIMQLAEP